MNGKKESISFLKKRNKKLLPVCDWLRSNTVEPAPALRDKSFLVLFFKKERFLTYLNGALLCS
jgi:hypothetical protein